MKRCVLEAGKKKDAPPGCKRYVHGLRCKSGRHRGVAEGELLRHAMLAAGFDVELEHLHCAYENTGLRPPCGCPENCTVLEQKKYLSQQQKDDLAIEWRMDRDAALMLAERMWNGV